MTKLHQKDGKNGELTFLSPKKCVPFQSFDGKNEALDTKKGRFKKKLTSLSTEIGFDFRKSIYICSSSLFYLLIKKGRGIRPYDTLATSSVKRRKVLHPSSEIYGDR